MHAVKGDKLEAKHVISCYYFHIRPMFLKAHLEAGKSVGIEYCMDNLVSPVKFLLNPYK